MMKLYCVVLSNDLETVVSFEEVYMQYITDNTVYPSVQTMIELYGYYLSPKFPTYYININYNMSINYTLYNSLRNLLLVEFRDRKINSLI